MKKKYVKIIIGLIVLIILIAFLAYLWPYFKEIYTKGGQEAFKQKIDSLGFKGVLLLFTLQIAQILLVVLPGEPFEVIAGMCYGTWPGALFITISVFITTIIIFFTVRKLGKKYLYNFFSEEKISKIENSKLLKNEQKVELILCLLFIVPGTPKDLLVYIGGLLPVKPWRFILISTFVRFPSVITSTMVGDSLSSGNLKMSIIIYAITFVITAISMLVIQKKDKNKEITEIIK